MSILFVGAGDDVTRRTLLTRIGPLGSVFQFNTREITFLESRCKGQKLEAYLAQLVSGKSRKGGASQRFTVKRLQGDQFDFSPTVHE